MSSSLPLTGPHPLNFEVGVLLQAG